MKGMMTYNTLLTRYSKENKVYLLGMGSRKICTADAMHRKRREGWLQHCPFRTTMLTAFTHLLSNVMRSKRFLSHLILTQCRCLKNNIRSRWEKFAWSYNLFFLVVQITILATARITKGTSGGVMVSKLDSQTYTSEFESHWVPHSFGLVLNRSKDLRKLLQLGSRETPHASSPETVVERCLRRNQRRAARTDRVWCEPSTPRRDPRTEEFARTNRRCAQPFFPNHCSSERNRACLPGPLWISSREGTTRSFVVQFVIFKNAFTFGRWCHDVLTVTVSWCYVITRELWFCMHFIHAEDFSLSTNSNLMHIAPWSKRCFSILCSDLNFPFCICRLFGYLSSVLSFFMHYCTKPLQTNAI